MRQSWLSAEGARSLTNLVHQTLEHKFSDADDTLRHRETPTHFLQDPHDVPVCYVPRYLDHLIRKMDS